MKKRFSKVLAFVMALTLTVGLAACGGGNKDNNNDTPGTTTPGTQQPGGTQQPSGSTSLEGTYDIVVWVSEVDGVKQLTEQQIDAFEAANPGIIINATVEGVSEADSATQMITSVEDGADIFCFAQDQLSRLVLAGAVNKLGVATTETVKSMNDDVAIKAATVGDALYCFPLTSDNGYFMYYDKRVVKESSLDSLEQIIADCEAAGKMFAMELETSAWYQASFFFATGCVSEWVTETDGTYVSVNDTFNSDKGIIALKGMQSLLKSPSYISSSQADVLSAAVPAAVLVSGTWVSGTVKEVLGENMGVTDLPSFTVDGQSYHLKSFSGNKLLGVKPQSDPVRAAVLQKLALWLSGEECQVQRYQQFGWGPSNLNAQATDAVKNDAILGALRLQNEYSLAQGQIHGSWWDIEKVVATAAKTATTDAELKAALQTYEDQINALFNMDPAVLRAFTVIGSINGDTWTVDLPMTEESTGVWVTNEAYTMAAGTEFKCRQGKSWDVAYGDNGNNFKVAADGTYKIKLTIVGEQGTVELLPQ